MSADRGTARERLRWRGTSGLSKLSLSLRYIAFLTAIAALVQSGYLLVSLAGPGEIKSTIPMLGTVIFSFLCTQARVLVDRKRERIEESTLQE